MGQTDIPAIATRRYPGTIGGEAGSVTGYKVAILIIGFLFFLTIYIVLRGNWEWGSIIIVILLEALLLTFTAGYAREMNIIKDEESSRLWIESYYEFKIPRDWPLVSITKRIIEGLKSHGMTASRIDVRGYQIPVESPYRGIMVGMRIEPGHRQIYVVLADEQFLFADKLPAREAAAFVVTPIKKPFDLEADPVAVLVAKVLWNQEVLKMKAGHRQTLSERELMGHSPLPTRLVLDPRYSTNKTMNLPRRR
jgi:hypothetical protein